MLSGAAENDRADALDKNRVPHLSCVLRKWILRTPAAWSLDLSIGRKALVEALKNNIRGKVTRELVPGTLEVYPIATYSAVEIGVHRFHHPGNADDVGEAKVIHLWQNKDGAWKVTRVISFDHHAAAE